MEYVAAEEVLAIHSEIIDATGGSHGVRDPHLLASLVEKPKGSFGGKELYPGVFLKAAIYLGAIARYHVFVDGNKRTAVAVAARFLYLNGYDLEVPNKNLEVFAVRVITKRMTDVQIASWLEKNSKET